MRYGDNRDHVYGLAKAAAERRIELRRKEVKKLSNKALLARLPEGVTRQKLSSYALHHLFDELNARPRTDRIPGTLLDQHFPDKRRSKYLAMSNAEILKRIPNLKGFTISQAHDVLRVLGFSKVLRERDIYREAINRALREKSG